MRWAEAPRLSWSPIPQGTPQGIPDGQGRSEDNQLGIVRQGHPGPVNGLVAEPCTLELFRVKIHYALADLMVHHDEIRLERKLRSLLETFEIIAYEQASGHHLPTFIVLGADGEDIHDRKILDEMGSAIFEDIADRGPGTSHYALHTVGRPQEMALVDSLGTSDSHEYVLGMVSHTYDLVRNDLTYGKDQVERRIEQQFVDLDRPAVADPPLRNLFHIGSRDFSYRHDIVAPVVDPELFFRNTPEHRGYLPVSHRGMGP